MKTMMMDGVHVGDTCIEGDGRFCLSAPNRGSLLTFSLHLARRPQAAMATTPTLIWAQRREKVFVTWESVSSTDVNVTLADGLLSLDGKDKAGKAYKLENMPLWDEIESEESKWFKNDRCVRARFFMLPRHITHSFVFAC